MYTLSIENQKGGTAKTTTTVSLAAAFAELGLRVLVVDLDEQASATSWLDVQPEGKGIFAVLAEGEPLTDHVYETGVPNVDLVPRPRFCRRSSGPSSRTRRSRSPRTPS